MPPYVVQPGDTLSEIAQPPHVALRPGLVESQLSLQLDSRLGTDLGVVAQPRHGTPRDEVDEGKGQKCDPEDQRDHLQQAANDVGGHRGLPAAGVKNTSFAGKDMALMT